MNSNLNISQMFDKSIISNNVTQIMDSNSNIFLKSSPLFRSFINTNSPTNNNSNKNDTSRNKILYCSTSTDRNKTMKNLKNRKIIKKQIVSLSPNFNDRDKLTLFYKTTLENKKENKKYEINKTEKYDLFQKYKIDKKIIKRFHLPKIEDKDLTYNIREKFFKSLDKANKIIQRNKQINLRVNEMTNYIQIEKYNRKINEDEVTKFYVKKMPRVNIKVLKNDEEELIENVKKLGKRRDTIINQEEKKKDEENIKNKKPKHKNSNISMNLFRRMSFNGILAANTINNQKKPKHEKHQVNALISIIKFANKPHSLSQFSINIYNNKLYLFGGLSIGYNNQLWVYDIIIKKWNMITINKYDEPLPRYGHSSVLIGNNIIIFGGETPKNEFKLPEDLIVYNIDNNKFTYPRIKKGRISQRKGHICVSTTQSMLIHGGMNIETLKIESSSYIFNAIKLSWSPLIYIGEKLPRIMYHNACMVNNYSYYTNTPYSFYKLPSNLPSNRLKKIKIEGVYIFGGINEERIINNDLYVISICKKPCEVFKPKIDGIPPEPRFNCKMVFISDYNFIVISGGTGNAQYVFNDLMILDLESLNWIKPIFEPENYMFPKLLIPRTEHEMFFHNGTIYLFGGRDENNYLKMDFETIIFEITNF